MEKDKELSKEISQQISFVAKRYQKNKFNANKDWQKLNIAPSSVSLWRRYRIAAVTVGAIVLTAVAGTALYNKLSFSEAKTNETVEVVKNPASVIKTIDFEYAPLPEVIEKINEVYSVEVINVPLDAESYNLSMHFEGNPVELLDAINEILGTEMSIKQ